MNLLAKCILLIAAICLFLLFFIGGPDANYPRSYQSFWNIGHILFFYLFTLIFVSFCCEYKTYLIQCVLALSVAVILGALIELMQFGLFQRKPDINDFFRNILGVMACISFTLPTRKTFSKTILFITKVVTVSLIAVQILPIAIALTDEHIARKQFPLLSGFETPFEIKRWYHNEDIETDDTIKMSGKASMRVVLDNRKYSGVELRYFPRKWEGYKFFQFAICNPSSEDILIILNIYDDEQGVNSMKYKDRFRRRLLIPRGWHTLKFSLEDVKQYPNKRQMKMHKIMNVRFFTLGLTSPRIIYIDDVKLL